MNEPMNMKLTVAELNLILEALGNMPYVRVHELIHNIHNQAQHQVNHPINQPAIESSDTHSTARAGNGVVAD